MKRRITAILVLYVEEHLRSNWPSDTDSGSFLRVVARSETLIRDKRFKKYLRSVFLGEDSKTKSLLEDLNKQTKGELEYVVASIYSTSRATLDVTTRLEKAQIEDTDKILTTIKGRRMNICS